MLRSNELGALSDSAFACNPPAEVGTVGGSTGAARRMNFGGGLKKKHTHLEFFKYREVDAIKLPLSRKKTSFS